MKKTRSFPPYRETLGGKLLAAREAVMAPIRPILRGVGVTEQQWRVLRTLVDHGALDASNVATSAILRAPSVTRILRELVDRELIVRTMDKTDGRRSIIEISPEGRILVHRILTQTVKLADSYALAFGPDRLNTLRSELTALVRMIGEVTTKSTGSVPPPNQNAGLKT